MEIGGRTLSVSNLAKVLFPEAGFTKADVIQYYVDVAEWLLPHLRDRALTLKRYPNGVTGAYFYEKRCPPHRPPWLKTAEIATSNGDRKIDYCIINDLASLVWAANLADLELHVSLALESNPDCPTALVFDLDPGPPADIVQCSKVAIWLREKLAAHDLNGFPKTSGSKGLQIYVPLNSPTSFKQTKACAKELAGQLAAEHPASVVAVMAKDARKGKVFIDWSQNDRHKTTVCAYSLRGKPQPTVSTPVAWREVEDCLRKNEPHRLVFTSDDVLARVRKQGDLFEPVLRLKQRLR